MSEGKLVLVAMQAVITLTQKRNARHKFFIVINNESHTSLWLQSTFYTLYGVDLSVARLEEFPAIIAITLHFRCNW